MQSAQNLLNDLTKILVEAEQKLEQAMGQVTSRLQKVDVSEQEDMAQVDKVRDCLRKLVEEYFDKLKEKTRKSYLKIRNSLGDVKTSLSNRLGKVTSHKHIVARAVAVSPRPSLMHMTQPLTDRVNSLNFRCDWQQEVWVTPVSSLKNSQAVVRRIEQELLMLEACLNKKRKLDFFTSASRSSLDCSVLVKKDLDAQPPVLVFHDNCGTNIRLTNGNRTAEKIDQSSWSHGVVVSRDAMVPNVLYEVRVDAVLYKYNNLLLGVTSISPTRLLVTELSQDLEDSVIVSYNGVNYQGEHVWTTLGEGLGRLKIGSHVGVLVDSSNDLHLYVNGQDKGVVMKRVTSPCFAVFEIWSSVTKMTALPTSRIT